jgi:hypothetical protein
MDRAYVADVLISYPDTFFVQGFYAYRISILAQTKRVAGAIVAVSRLKHSTGFKI